MKKLMSLGLVLVFVLLAACGSDKEPVAKEPVATEPAVDVVTTASIVNNEEAFLNAISKDGTWIIATLNDLKIDKDLVLDGPFTNRDVAARKIALYEQDADKNITASYTLTAPKLTVTSENARIQGGTFVGDVYVEANGFQLVDAKVEGNVYFASEEFKASFDVSEKGVVTGVTEVK
ncbi:hypothetical protein ACP8HI_01375 [Paenibacillus sp. FA6]|uniref:hypothetical protein n=1 Tax=Paenibacillus sp. FA6 TaxID=3413029 RepID=UPI003F65A66D